MRTIWKFPLDITDQQWIDLPKGSTPLHVAFQGQTLNLWAEASDDVTVDRRWSVWIVGTGNPITNSLAADQFYGRARYFGTVHDPRRFVWHVYLGEPS